MYIDPMELLRAIQQWQQNREKPESHALDRESIVRIPPQVTWTLLMLIRYGQQIREARVYVLEQLSEAMESQHEERHGRIKEILERSPEGQMPGIVEWGYAVSAGLGRATKRDVNEWIALERDRPEELDSEFFRQYLVTSFPPRAAQQRLLQLFPEARGIIPAIRQLCDDSVLKVVDPFYDLGLSFTICDGVDQHDDAVRSLLEAWEDESSRLTLALVIGDYLAVSEMAAASGNVELAEKAAAKAEPMRQRWLSRLRNEVDGLLYDDLMWALAEAKPEEFPTYLSAALDEGDEGNAAKAAEQIIARDPRWREQLDAVS